MFTGIVQDYLPVKTIDHKPSLLTFSVELTPVLLENLQIGASVAIDGVCLTVTAIDGNEVFFHAMMETLRLTTLQYLAPHKKVNIERSSRIGDEMGGHRVSGHVSNMAQIVAVHEPTNNRVLTLEVPKDFMKYVIQKGFIALDGCSLTVGDVDRNICTFDVWLIPETMARTGFGVKGVGDYVNIEFDPTTQVIVDTVERIMKE